jgi:hypothetical protein
MSRFTLTPRRWYAAEFIGEEFGDEIRSDSPIRVDAVEPANSGQRTFTLAFYHANYPEGVRDKRYELKTIERTSTFLLARSLEHKPARLLLIYEITWEWIERHFGRNADRDRSDVQRWLSGNA